MTRMLTTLTVLMLTGLSTMVLIGMATVGRDADPRPRAAEAPEKTDLGPVHVRVMDARGASVPGIAIEVHAWDQSRRTVSTDAEGRAVIPREAIGDGAILLVRRDRESLAWAALGDWSPNATVGTGDDPVIMKLLPLTHRVEGSVVDDQGKPIAGAEIQVGSFPYPIDGTIHFAIQEPNQLLVPATTDDKGRFVLMLPEGVGAGIGVYHPRYIGPAPDAMRIRRPSIR